MNFTDIRLRFQRFFRNNRKIILIVFLIWVIIFGINQWVKNKAPSTVPQTNLKSNVSIMQSSSSVPKSLHKDYTELISQYVEYCNDGEFELAFRMLSEDCRKYRFNDDVRTFMAYLVDVIPTPKEHSAQSYSNTTINGERAYIYQVKYFDDILATGLTDQEYSYTEEKIVFTEGQYGMAEMSVGNYMYHEDIKRISENEYLKVDVIDKVVNYSIEKYNVVLTNRSDKIIVVADDTEKNEVVLALSAEVRERDEHSSIVLQPYESKQISLTFFKFVDDSDISAEISFENIRVMEKYSGTEGISDEVIAEEKNNAVAKFSTSVVLQ